MPFFVAAVVAGAFCLFLVQPLLAKQLLPLAGGAAAIWAVCMVFYQGLLLGGYIYAHALNQFFKPAAQAAIHWLLIGLSLLSLPLGLAGPQRPLSFDEPAAAILLILFRTVGLPYFVLSATSPLMQAWLARTDPQSRAYRLFGWSNLSCAAALLSFPFLLEPLLAVPQLNAIWSAAYLAAAAAIAAAAAAMVRRRPAAAPGVENHEPAPRAAQRLQWLFYSALGTMTLVGATNHLCQMVAPIPFLWTVPLLAYLMTFVVVFEREWRRRWLAMGLAGAAAAGMSWAIVFLPAGRMLAAGIPVFVTGCFLVCLFCHGELAARKPGPERLTEFYILMAAGGALGSLFIAFLAPRIFRGYAEFPVTLAITGLVILFSAYRRYSIAADMAAACCAALTLAPAYAYLRPQPGEVAAARNFFGALRVKDEPARAGRPALRKLYHGGTAHGSQFLDGRRKATAYYGPRSGPGVWFQNKPGPRNIGVVGLGAGTLAVYLRPGDKMTFYEINPLVAEFAGAWFTYLRSARGEVTVRLGDGRLLLASEPPNGYDLIVLDAFSDDSIPAHLLTREAVALYLRHLRPGGVLAFHVSNRYLELQPVVWRLARDAGLVSAAVLDPGDESEGLLPSSWALAGRVEDIAKLPADPEAHPEFRKAGPVWTDNYSSLLRALK